MKRYIKSADDILGMAHVNPVKSKLPVSIWSDHSGITRHVSHNNTPRVKIEKDDFSVSVSIEPEPKVFAASKNIPKSILNDIKEGMRYVGRNYDIFLKHFNDTDNSFDDEDMFNELRVRGEYR